MSEKFQAPAFLNETGRAEWSRIVRLLEERDLLDEIRRSSVEGYCTAYQRWHDAEEKLSAAAAPEEVDRLVGLSNTYQRHLRNHARDLGLPANAQVRNKAIPPADEPEPELRTLEEWFTIPADRKPVETSNSEDNSFHK